MRISDWSPDVCSSDLLLKPIGNERATSVSDLRDTAMQSKAWPFEEARTLLHRHGQSAPDTGYMLFENGTDPSGVPHFGKFNEVLRATMVHTASEALDRKSVVDGTGVSVRVR